MKCKHLFRTLREAKPNKHSVFAETDYGYHAIVQCQKCCNIYQIKYGIFEKMDV